MEAGDDAAASCVGPNPNFNDGPGIGNQLGLPTIVFLKLLHGSLGLSVPMAGCFSREIARFDQRSLDLAGSVVVNAALTGRFRS